MINQVIIKAFSLCTKPQCFYLVNIGCWSDHWTLGKDFMMLDQL